MKDNSDWADDFLHNPVAVIHKAVLLWRIVKAVSSYLMRIAHLAFVIVAWQLNIPLTDFAQFPIAVSNKC